MHELLWRAFEVGVLVYMKAASSAENPSAPVQVSYYLLFSPLRSQLDSVIVTLYFLVKAIMGFLGPVPADQVTAVYFTRECLLRLKASGNVPPATTGIKFHHDSFVGGLKYTLEGWTDPVCFGTEQYEVELAFSIQLPNPVIPSDNVVVVTANHPDGLTVPIHFEPKVLSPKTATETVTPAAAAKPDAPRVEQKPTAPAPPVSKAHLAENEQINTLLKVGSFLRLLSLMSFRGSQRNWRPR